MAAVEVDSPPASQSFNELVDQHGATAMIVELVLLGIGTFGAIAFDQRMEKRQSLEALASSMEESS